ncbi:dGTPase inhibitor; target for F exclusion [Escherichia phage vB_EcoP_S523]|uniref:Host dGTPase inhibitor n=1 Tax=Escherichia phage vB_EcoP_S523 TaxID=2233775 RepID=A0A2Z4Q438_9CAUD|nr:dGTPase inhibitor; target for F exclusion [Escherichia phage vB_EcoP_S523]AWY04258.1 host dGTPase inhibitor [Escherichia phage vB_EcoP_S523]
MGRLYSGNLIAYKDAIERLKEDHDVRVVTETFRYNNYARMRWVSGETLRVVLRNGVVLTSERFEQDDADVRCNAQTEWLRKVHADLKHWK